MSQIIDIQPDPTRAVHHQDELVLLALNCRQEARGEHGLPPRYPSATDPSALEEMLAVAWVVVNRAERRKQSIRQVILAPKQFSWLNPADPNLDEAKRFVKRGTSYQDSWRTATAAAFLAYYRLGPDISAGADHYLNWEVAQPSWADRMKKTAVWGRHTFLDSRRAP